MNLFSLEAFNTSITNSFSNLYVVIILSIFFLIATYTDMKYMKIYNKFNIVMLIARICVIPLMGLGLDFILGGLVIFMTYLMIAIQTGDKMGGDIKFGGNIGLWLGLTPSILIVILSVVLNLISRFFSKKTGKVPLAPSLAVGYLIIGLYYYFFLI